MIGIEQRIVKVRINRYSPAERLSHLRRPFSNGGNDANKSGVGVSNKIVPITEINRKKASNS